MTELSLVDLWHHTDRDPGMQLVDPSHTLEMYIGVTEVGQARLIIRSRQKPATPQLSSLVLVERYEHSKDRWVLSFTLQDSKYEEVFFKLTDDVHARTTGAPNEVVALARAATVIDEWRRLLRPKAQSQLSMEELRGLVGELWLVLNRFSQSRSIEDAINGWLGPLGLPQDLYYPDHGYHEIKAIGPSTVRLHIASEHQLDAKPLQLHVLTVPTVSESVPEATTVMRLIQQAREVLFDGGYSAEPLDERLQQLGLDPDDPFYTDTWFAITATSTYAVSGVFPAITASTLPPGIARVSYQLELAQLDEYLVGSAKES